MGSSPKSSFTQLNPEFSQTTPIVPQLILPLTENHPPKKSASSAPATATPAKENKSAQKNQSVSSQTAKQAVDDILKSLKTKNKPLEDKMNATATAIHSPGLALTKTTSTGAGLAQLMKGYQPSLMSWGAAFLDTLLIFAASLLCMIILLTVTRVDLLKTVAQSTDKEIYLALFGLFALVNFMYMTVHRVFLGQTPGEWAFDQRLGTVEEQLRLDYIFKASFRSLVTILTGFFIFPLFTLITGRDLLSEVTNLDLYQKNS
jgi:hypothetical protein